MDEFVHNTQAYIWQHQMMQKGDTVIVALSGGADSMALFHVLLSVRRELGLQLRAAHVNHGLRGTAADADAAFVREQCARCAVPLDEVVLTPPSNAGEAWGRDARYAFFAQLADRYRAKVATAHTASDNAETVLFRMARGTAVRGAAGIPPVRDFYIRPLLWACRSDVEAYLARCGVPYVTDATNDTDQYARNRVRHGALPALESAHAGATENIARFAAEMTLVSEYLEAQAKQLLQRARQPRASYLPQDLPPSYRVQVIADAHPAVRHTALALLIAAAAPQQKTSLTLQADALLSRQNGAIQLCKDQYLSISQGLLTVRKTHTRNADASVWTHAFKAGQITAPGGMMLDVRCLKYEEMVNSAKDSAKDVRNPLNFYADYDKIQGNPRFRTRRAGDLFCPAGRGVTKPLKKWFSEAKVPLSARDCLPVLACGTRVLWAAGFGFAQGLSVEPDTKIVVSIQARQTEEIK